ncbi:MAG: pacearchaeosortase [archaeon]
MNEITDLRDISIRYFLLVLVALPNLWIFYFIFTPLTVYPVYFVLGLFYETFLIKNVILVNGLFPIELIKACIAGSAYYLLLILNLSTPRINPKKRINLLVFSFVSLLAINVIRIIILSLIFLEGLPGFILTHKILWYFMSTIFVAGIWFSGVKIFKIKEIPIYSDLKFLYKKTKSKK